MWQALRAELHPRVEVVTVALDLGGVEAAGPWIDAASPEHPSLIDESHLLDELLGVRNVPTGVWIDEDGVLVRPPEVAHPGTSVLRDMLREHGVPDDTPQIMKDTLAEAARFTVQPERYGEALRDWAEKGSASEFALTPDEVVERSRPRPPQHSQAAAHFELGQHLYRAGDADGARAHFRRAHRLDPSNWTYKRQAWSFEDAFQGPTEHYDGDWIKDVRASDPADYYPLPDL